MDDINNLVYFLNSVKNALPFEDENDFREKINENSEFKIKVQKLVYLSKFFGWNNPYIFTLAQRGPYSVELKHFYTKDNLFDNIPKKIDGINLSLFLDFISNKNLLFLEATSTILYKFKDNIGENECVSSIHSLKNYIPSDIIHDAYNNIVDYGLYDNVHSVTAEEIDIMTNQVTQKIQELSEYFEKFEPSTNRIILLGSMDYMRIAIRESNLGLKDTFDLLIFIKRYLSIIEELSKEIISDDVLTYFDLDDLEELFNQFQDFVSQEHHILKKIDDDDFDESLCYY